MSLSGWINRVYDERPELLASSDNEVIVELFKKQFPRRTGAKQITRLRQNVNNVKSQRRHKGAKGGGAARAAAPAVAVRQHRGAGPTIQRLEERIDDVLAMARGLDPEGLGEVIQSLRTARNAVVRMGPGH
jgi:hypothetical protein